MAASPAQKSTKPQDPRRRLQRALMAACRKRGIDDDVRRDITEQITGKRSSKDLTLREFAQVLDRINRGAGGNRARPDRAQEERLKPKRAARAESVHPVHGKIRALWWTCYWLGLVDLPGEDDQAIDAFVRRQTGIDALRFVTHRQAPAVIEALKDMARRAGVDAPGDAEKGRYGDNAERFMTVQALAAKLIELGVWTEGSDPLHRGWITLNLRHDARKWSGGDWDILIRDLGDMHRRAITREKRGDV